jgi:hypothetical protein
MFPGNLRYLINGNGTHALDNNGNRELLNSKFASKDKKSIWLGIEAYSSAEELPSSITLTVSSGIPDIEQEITYVLEYVDVTNPSGQAHPSYRGQNRLSGKDDTPFSILEERVDVIENRICNYYDQRFLTIDISEGLVLGSDMDAEVKSRLGIENELENMYWVQLKFPAQLSEQSVAEVTCLLNCFPCINRELKHRITRLDQKFNIRALENDSDFLELESVVTEDGVQLHENPSISMSHEDKGCFTLRYSGFGRVNERDAHEMVAYVVDQIKDETQAFSAMDVDNIKNDLKTINHSLEKIKKSIPPVSDSRRFPYIVLYPHKVGEKVHISYWVTQAELANGLKPGQYLRPLESANFLEGEAHIQSESLGGYSFDSSRQRINELRSKILSRGRIVTIKDIENRSTQLFGNTIGDIEISKGVALSDKPQSGMMRTIDIKVWKQDSTISSSVWKELCHQVEFDLNQDSNLSMPIRIIENA